MPVYATVTPADCGAGGAGVSGDAGGGILPPPNIVVVTPPDITAQRTKTGDDPVEKAEEAADPVEKAVDAVIDHMQHGRFRQKHEDKLDRAMQNHRVGKATQRVLRRGIGTTA